MKTYKPYQIIIIVLFSMIVNVTGRIIADTLNLPLWMDSFGTFFTSYTLGPICGVFVGVSGNILHGFINPISFAYSLASIFIALISGVLASKGWLESLLKTLTMSVLVTLVCVTISVFLNIAFQNGNVGNNWGNSVTQLLTLLGLPRISSIIIGQFYVDFLDKTATLVSLFFFIKIYRSLKPYLPGFLKVQGVPACSQADGRALRTSADAPLAPGPTPDGGAPIPNAEAPTSNSSKKIQVTILLIFMTLAFAPEMHAAKSHNFSSYAHTVINKENGIPSGKTNDIASTNDGILWIGTYEGLYRHNGHEFRLMTEFESIKAVRCLYVDDEGRLFVGTNDNGLSIIINEEIVNVIDELNGLPSDAIRCITRGADGLYYVGTSEDLTILSIANGLRITATIPQIQTAVTISADEEEHIAAVSSNGELFILQGSKIIWKSNPSNELFTAAAFSPEGYLYTATTSNKIIIYSIKENELFKVTELSCKKIKNVKSINFFEDNIFLCADNGIGYIQNGELCILETGSFNNSIEKMTEDYQGNFWFTSSRLGLLKLCRSSFEEIYSAAGLPESVVNSTAVFNGVTYFATDDGLMAADIESNKRIDNKLTELLSDTRVRCLTITKDGSMWISTKSEGLIHVTTDGKIKSLAKEFQFRTAIELSDGTIAAGTNAGVLIIQDEKIIQCIDEKDGLVNSVILCLSETKNHKLLAGTDGGGLAVISRTYLLDEPYKFSRLIKKTDGLSSNVILRIINDTLNENSSGIFIITSNGICYIDSDLKQVSVFSNFPFSNNYDLIPREDGKLFILSSAGIFVVNHDELLSGNKIDYELLDLKKGLRGSLTSNSWNWLDENGDLYLSCDTGASKINLNNYDRSEHSYRIQLKSVLIDGKRHIVQKDIPFTIPHDAFSIEIIPEIINYSIYTPYISLYFEGIDEKPAVLLQNELSSVIYSNLKAGTYHFHIAVLDSKGRDILEESVYTITKTYHMHDYWWFKLYLIGVAMLAIIWMTWIISYTVQERRAGKQKKEMDAIKNQVRMGNETIFSIANAVEARDKSTGRHSYRVAEYAVMIARELGFNNEELDQIRKIGLLHDIGKIGVPDNILNKPTTLTAKEYEIMKTHTTIGGEILKDFTLIPNVDEGAKYHHERYDGLGYPKGLKGEEIPLKARIIGIADTFDAMTAKRVYRDALKINSVIKELKQGAGTQFDPGLVEIMIDLIESGKLNIHKTVQESYYEPKKEEAGDTQ